MRRKADAQVESEPVKGYREQLDFEKAEATATWREGDIEYERLMFVSRTDDVLVVRVRGSKAGSVTTHIGLAPHEPVEDIWPKYMGSSKEYLLGRKAYTDEPITYKTRARGAWLTLSGKYWDGRQFGGVGRVVAKGGRQEVVGKHIAVKNADEVLVILKLFTNEKRGRQAIKQLRSEIGAMTAEYESLLETHVKEHKELLSRITLDLNAGEDRELSNKELLEKARNGEIPASLVERLFEYGRYLLICSSRPGGLPANLQGVWSGTWTPAWACDYTINENVQMAYWQALPGNMAEVTEPYFDYFDSLIPDWQVNARRFWGCRGIASYLRASDHGLMVQWAPWQFWTAGPGWLAQLYYDYYLYTGDREFLEKRAAPFMKEVALFYEDFVVEGADGKYMFSPSMSPENRPSNTRCRTTVNATMDIAVAKEVLGNLAEACRALGIEPEGVERWEKMLRKFPEYIIGPDGALKEWTAGDLDDSHGHRHMSQIYPLFPGFELDSDEGDAAVREGCRVVLEKKFDRRGDFAAWSCAHQANGFARLGDGQKAVESLRR
ncbi:MAG: glycosyl hydrolase family 95 catalytic domain-containing protein, partial [Planctomycetota bacterium]